MPKKDGSVGPFHSFPYNEVNTLDANRPDVTGDGCWYGGFDELVENHAKDTGPLLATPNTASTHDLFGGPGLARTGSINPTGASGMAGEYVKAKTPDGGAPVSDLRTTGKWKA